MAHVADTPMSYKVKIPTDLHTRAEWWCALNGLELPVGVTAEMTNLERTRLFTEINNLPGVLDAGLAVWRMRFDNGQYPQNGDPRPASTVGGDPPLRRYTHG